MSPRVSRSPTDPTPIRGPLESAVPDWDRTSTPARPEQMDYLLEALEFQDLFDACEMPGPRAKRRRLVFKVSVLIEGLRAGNFRIFPCSRGHV